MIERQWTMASPVGPLYLVATERALTQVMWAPQDVPFVSALDDLPVLARTVRQLDEYFSGQRRAFDLPLEPTRGTPFQRAVWAALMKIPFGETRSYRALARDVERAGAIRAVGSANGRNPLSIVVPCHRVITSDGRLGGFAGGVDVKLRLLELEGVRLARAGRANDTAPGALTE